MNYGIKAKKGFTTACQIKDLFARYARHSARNGGLERFRLCGFAYRKPAIASHTCGRLAFAKCKALSSSFAFTLAEVLITLAIIGVVAALTIPAVIRNYKIRQTVTAVKKAHSQLESAFKMGIVENGPIESATLENSTKFTNTYFKPYLKVLKDCGVGIADNCYNVTVKNTANNNIFVTSTSSTPSYSLILADGMVMSFRSEIGCTRNESKTGVTDKMLSGICGYVYIDINGETKPNRAGVDVFTFWITKYGIVPLGGPNDKWSASVYCNPTGTHYGNGEGCAAWVIAKENMDYLDHNISW